MPTNRAASRPSRRAIRKDEIKGLVAIQLQLEKCKAFVSGRQGLCTILPKTNSGSWHPGAPPTASYRSFELVSESLARTRGRARIVRQLPGVAHGRCVPQPGLGF